MSDITIDLENTLYMNGILTSEELSSDNVCSWMIESYYRQKEEIAGEIDNIKEMLKNIDEVLEEAEAGDGIEDQDKEEVIADLEKDIAMLESKKPLITLIINSPGGEYDHLVQIYDTIQLIDADVRTIVNGSAFSAGALLAISGSCGLRYMTPSSRFMFHAVSMGMEGKAQEIKVDYKEAERLNQQMHKLIITHTGLSEEEAMKYIDRDIYITPEEAVKLGMIDAIVSKIV